jgi:membrane protein YdbS with pleckstrin-like domain
MQFVPADALRQALTEFGLLAVALAIVFTEFAFRNARYTVRDETLEVVRGMILPRTLIVPLTSIQRVETHEGAWSRLFGISTLKLTTTMGPVKIQGVKDVAMACAILLKK